MAIEKKEFDAAAEAAKNAKSTYTLVFKKPVVYGEKTYTALNFDFEKLTGADGLNIEAELQALGKAVIVPTLSGEYLMRMAAKACDQPIGADFFNAVSLAEYNKIRSAARSFLLASES